MARPRIKFEVPNAARLSDAERVAIGREIAAKRASPAEVGVEPGAGLPDTRPAVIPPPEGARERLAVAGEISPRKLERGPVVPYRPRAAKADALKEVESYAGQIADLKIVAQSILDKLRPYLDLSPKARRQRFQKQPAEAREYRQLVDQLGAINAQAALDLPDIPPDLQSTLQELQTQRFDEIVRLRDELDKAARDAKERLGATDEEIRQAAPEVVPEAAPPAVTPETREAPSVPETPRLVEPPPAEAATEQLPREPGKAKRRLFEKLLNNTVIDNLTKAFGANLPLAIALRRQESKTRKSVGENVGNIMKEIDQLFTQEARKLTRENEPLWFFALPEDQRQVFDQKVETLRTQVNQLVSDGKLSAKRRDQILGEIADTLSKRAKEFDAPTEQVIKDGDRIVDDYLIKKVTGFTLAKEAVNTGLFVTQQYLARGLALFAMGPIERALKQKKEYELDLRAKALREGEALEPGVLEKAWEVVAKRTIAEGVKEYGMLWAGKGMDKLKALLITARYASIGFSAYSQWDHGGVTEAIRRNVQEFQDQWDKDGPFTAIGNSFVRYPERVWKGMKGAWHLVFGGERGQETLQTHSEVHPVKPAAIAGVPAAEAPPVETPEEFLSKHGVIKSLVEEHRAVLDGHRLTIPLGDRAHGFEEVQQGLRRVILQDLDVKGDHLTDIEMDRAEKIIKILTHTVHHERLHAQWFAKDFDQAKIDALLAKAKDVVHLDDHGDLVVEDVDKFKTLMPELEHMADKYNVSMMAYLNNTKRSISQGIMDARAHGTGIKIIVDDFDKSPAVHKAEIQVAQYEAQTTGIPGLEVRPEDVADEHNYAAHLGNNVVPVENGVIHKITAAWQGQEYTHALDAPIDLDHPYAGDELAQALDKAYTSAIKEFGGKAEAAAVAVAPEGGAVEAPAPDEAGVQVPRDARALTRPIDEGGLRAADGKLHFGEFAIPERWFMAWDDMPVKDFIEDAPARFSPARLFSAENDAHYKLAQAMELHEANPKMSVGQWAVQNYKKIGEWVK
ncbi:hypothetical protein HYW17_04335 [Candidatus Uhrbacteria bacterium]|nr:hypothetical protein [Candidatus Uhrbacteria bacterium]